MGLNIKNERVYERVKRLAELTGTSMTAAVDDAVSRRIREVEDHNLRPETRAFIERLREVVTPEMIERTRHSEADLYDENGLFK